MDLSLIIPVRRRSASLFRLLDSIDEQVHSLRLEIIVVANPPDKTLRVSLAGRANVLYRETANVGANFARNVGVESATGSILLFIDDDCELTNEHFLRSHWEAHLKRPQCAGLGGPYLPGDLKRPVARAYHRVQMRWLREAPQPGFVSDLLLGGNMSFKREVFENLRFDETLRFGGTETEFLFRLVAKGFRTQFLPALAVTHGPGFSLFAFLLKAFKQGGGAAYLAQKAHYGVPLAAGTGPAKEGRADPAMRVLLFLHRAFFRVGFACGPGAASDRWGTVGPLAIGLIYLAGSMLWAPIYFLYYFFLVDGRVILGSAISLRVRGVLERMGAKGPSPD